MPPVHYRLTTGYTACGLLTNAVDRSLPPGQNIVGGPLFTTDQFRVTCPACISRME